MKKLIHPPPFVRDTALLIARVILGVVLIAHGLQKFAEWTIPGTAQSFAEMGVPLPEVAAPVAAVVELVGGVLLLVGAFAAVTGLVVALQMAAAAVIVHVGNGLFAADGGWELVGVIAAAALAVGVAGAGRYSVDEWLVRRRAGATRHERELEPVDARR